MKKIISLPSDQLCQVTDPKIFKFITTDEVRAFTEFVGQKRALEAARFGLNISSPGYNLFTMGPTGGGKRIVISHFLEAEARKKSVPSDWCYVNNFDNPQQPISIKLTPGLACEFREDMKMLIEDLRISIPIIFESDEYRARMQKISDELHQEQESLLRKISEDAKSNELLIVSSQEGFTVVPVNKKGEAMSTAEYSKLSTNIRNKKEELITAYSQRLSEFLKKIPRLHKVRRKKENETKKEFTFLAIGRFINDLKDKYKKFAPVINYLDLVQKDIIVNFKDFLKREEDPTENKIISAEKISMSRYEVNVLVDNSKTKGAPIIYEDLPSYSNLICRIDHIAEFGTLFTDFTLIKPGALHKANGGYLMIDVTKILAEPFAWEGLKRALLLQKIIIESPERMSGLLSTVSMDPMPIPLDVKVILIGDRMIYSWLRVVDPDFEDLFKVAVDFDEEVARTPENLQTYAQLIATLAKKNDLLAFHRDAVAHVIDYSTRLAEDTDKLSGSIRNIYDLIREASYCAEQRAVSIVEQQDVKQAITAQTNRLDRLREQAYEQINRHIILISTSGSKIGQINGLSLIEFGSFVFGHPSRISVQVRCGDRHVIDIQREVDLSGPIHSKGVLILSGYLGGKFLKNVPLSLSASLVFEQTYGFIEGDSASAAELCVLLSALAQVPIKQNLAITGSVNQFGEMQAIGGVNEKIEGFFDICCLKGLTGDQGVIIPSANVKNLMLKEELVQAAKVMKFHVYAVNTIDEAITILTGIPAGELGKNGQYRKGTINYRVEKCLEDFSEAKTKQRKIIGKKLQKRLK